MSCNGEQTTEKSSKNNEKWIMMPCNACREHCRRRWANEAMDCFPCRSESSDQGCCKLDNVQHNCGCKDPTIRKQTKTSRKAMNPARSYTKTEDKKCSI